MEDFDKELEEMKKKIIGDPLSRLNEDLDDLLKDNLFKDVPSSIFKLMEIGEKIDKIKGGEKNMRTVKKEMDHDEYAHICDGIDTHIPWGLVSRDYNNRLMVGIFRFWDESYIPEKLRPYMIKPPNHDELVTKLNDFLTI